MLDRLQHGNFESKLRLYSAALSASPKAHSLRRLKSQRRHAVIDVRLTADQFEQILHTLLLIDVVQNERRRNGLKDLLRVIVDAVASSVVVDDDKVEARYLDVARLKALFVQLNQIDTLLTFLFHYCDEKKTDEK